MFRFALLSLGIAYIGVAHADPVHEPGIVVVHVANTQDDPVSGVVIGIRGDGGTSPRTDMGGRTRLRVAPDTRPGAWIGLQIIPGASTNSDWVFISPWDGQVMVPPFDNSSSNVVRLVVARRADRAMLRDGRAVSAVAQSIVSELARRQSQSRGQAITYEQRRDILLEQSQHYGFTPDEIDQAIRVWSERTNDPFEVGIAALYQRNYPEAEEALTRSLARREQEMERLKEEFNDAQSRVVDAAFFLGQSLAQQGNYSAALEAYQRAAELRPNDVKVLGELAATLEITENFAAAEPIRKKILGLQEQVLSGNDAALAGYVFDLGAHYSNQGKIQQAEPFFVRAVQLVESDSLADPSLRSRFLNNLAMLYLTQGKTQKADSLLSQALSIQQAYEPTHPETVYTLNTLGMLSMMQGDLERADSMLSRAFSIFKIVLQTADDTADGSALARNYMTTASYLTELYRRTGRDSLSIPLLESALALEEQAEGPNSPRLVAKLTQLGELYFRLDRHEDFERTYRRILDIQERVFGNESIHLVDALDRLAGYHEFRENPVAAESLYARMIRIAEAGDSMYAIAKIRNDYAFFLIRQERFSDAESQFQAAERTLRSGNDEFALAALLHNYAVFKMQRGNIAGAEAFFKEAREILEKDSRYREPLLILLNNYSELLRTAGREGEAADLDSAAGALRSQPASNQ